MVLALILAASEVEAVVTSDCIASAPTERPAPVRVRDPNVHTCEAVRPVALVASWRPIVPGVVRVDVATFQTSAARVPKLESVLPVDAHTAVGIVEARLVEAVKTVASVWELIVEMAEVNWESVWAFTLVATDPIMAPREVLAFETFVPTVASVEPREVDAALVLLLIAV